jgi:hypothetical protein
MLGGVQAAIEETLEDAFCAEVILAKGRRIELKPDFDAVQLRRAVEVLEGF